MFSLLTGYCDPPEGYDLKEGLHYNPYFAGGAIGMAQALYPGVYDYPDGMYHSVTSLCHITVHCRIGFDSDSLTGKNNGEK